MGRTTWFSVLVVFALAGCSGRRPPVKKKAPPPPPKKPAAQTTTPKVETPKPAAPETKDAVKEPAKEAAKKEEPKAETPAPAKPATPPATPAKKEEPKAPPAPASVKDAPLGPATGYENEFAGGKTVRAWIKELESGDRQRQLDACEIFKMVGKRAGMAAPKLEALTHSSDDEVAKSAREALHAVKTKQ